MTLRIIAKYSGGDDDHNAEIGNSNLGGENDINYLLLTVRALYQIARARPTTGKQYTFFLVL